MDYGLFFFCFGFCCTAIVSARCACHKNVKTDALLASSHVFRSIRSHTIQGQAAVTLMLRKYKRESFIVLSIGFVILLSACLMGFQVRALVCRTARIERNDRLTLLISTKTYTGRGRFHRRPQGRQRLLEPLRRAIVLSKFFSVCVQEGKKCRMCVSNLFNTTSMGV